MTAANRASVTLHRLGEIVEGELDELLDAVQTHANAQALAEAGAV